MVLVALADAATRTTDLGHAQIGPGHVLLGLAGDRRSNAAGVLESLGVNVATLVAVVGDTQPRLPVDKARHVPLDMRVRAVLDQLVEHHRDDGKPIGTNELLLALLDSSHSDVRTILSRVHVEAGDVREKIIEWSARGLTDQDVDGINGLTRRIAGRAPDSDSVLEFERRPTN